MKLKSVDLTVSLESLSFFLAQVRRWGIKHLARIGARASVGGSPRRAETGARTASPGAHVDIRGRVKMVDVGDKPVTQREAVARGTIAVTPGPSPGAGWSDQERQSAPDRPAGRHHGRQADLRADPAVPSAAARRAGSTSRRHRPGIASTHRSRTSAQTGVEMEALTAVSAAALTIYDMVKAVDARW